jgi:hypothetical protein
MPTISLLFAACATLINFWLAIRCGRVRVKEKILHGDGGSGLLARRMRAQANFVEYTPFVLILALALEMAGTPQTWLWIAAAVYLVARICHALGMDAEQGSPLRSVGIALTFLVMLALVVLALITAYGLLETGDMHSSMAMV